MVRLIGLVGLFALALSASAQVLERTLTIDPQGEVRGGARHALVIGNGAYGHGPLRNPVNDARAIAKTLADTGFEVLLVENATQVAMRRAIRTFGDKIAAGGVGLFYYAGHGIQLKGRNYLVPVNAEIEREYEIEFAAVDVNLVLAMMDAAANPLNIVILDACRNNPFARSFRSVQLGLAQMDAPAGTFIAFATAPGSVADDGAGENGVYTKYLLAEMMKPGVPIELVFKQVRNGVMKETRGRQVPWESSSMRGEFAFQPGPPPLTAEVEKLIQAALERQRQQLEALGLRIPESIAAPVAAALAARGLPQAGDSWSYRLSEPNRRDGPKHRRYDVKVAAASPGSILEHYAVERGPSGEWAHSGGGYLVGTGVSLFSPYLGAFEDLTPASSLGRVTIADPACSGRFFCHASASVLGKETVRVPAGSFEAIKVRIAHMWRSNVSGNTGNANGGRDLIVWYAPEVKRAVKFSSRLNVGEATPIEPDFDLELVSFKLN